MADDARRLEGVLELRIHGINNTSPAAMLDLPEGSIERVVGDDLASFWREQDGAQAGLEPGDRGWRPTGLTREAYSWGGLARNTPDVPGEGPLSAIGRGIARVGWALLLPFGIANVAYWTRRLQTADDDDTDPSRGRGAGSARLFALGLTALTVVTACEVAMDLVATQCYRDQVARCDRLPNLVDVLAGRETALRLVMAAVVPLGLLLVLYLLSSVTRSYYERSTSEAYAARGVARQPRRVLLATPGFWSGEAMVGRLVRLHLSVGVALVTLAMAWPATFGGGADCRAASSLVEGECWDQVYSRDPAVHGWLVTCTLAAVIVIVVSGVTSCRRATDAPDVPNPPAEGGDEDQRADHDPDSTSWLLGLAVGDLLATAALMMFGKPSIDDDSSLLGVSAAPTVTVGLLAALALGGLAWRLDRFGLVWAPLLAVLFVTPAFSRWWLLVLAAVVLGLVARLLTLRGPSAEHEHRYVAWWGTAPGILMSVAVMVTMTLASLVTLVAGDWLNGRYPASDLIRPVDRVVTTAGKADPRLLVPSPYVLFGAATLIALVIVALTAVAVLFRTAAGDAPPSASASVPVPGQSKRLRRSRARARRLAGRAHRAEKAAGLLGLLGGASVTVVLMLAARGWPDEPLAEDGWDGFARKVIDLGTLGLAAVGTAVLAALVGGKTTGRTRPLGLLWDLVCFLPRAAHPFGPPCYAERAVPEIVGRCAWWLDTDHPQGEGRTRRGDRIVLSAHSLGSVLAVAALFALPSQVRDQPQHPLRLLTYGSQLRAYFGRIFPELLGPQVLGTAPVRSAQLWRPDPWAAELSEPTRPVDESLDSVVTRLGGTPAQAPRWRSLWRRTDFLGFPVCAFSSDGNDIDRPAEETDESAYLTEIVTHGMYQRAPAYERAFDELVPPPVPQGDRETRTKDPLHPG